jgi:hypothetical protein
MRLAVAVLTVSVIAFSVRGPFDNSFFPRSAEAFPADAIPATSSSDAFLRVAAAAKKGSAKPKSEPKETRTSYANVPLAERASLQFDLAWTGHFNGLINGDFNDKSVAAVRAFQKDFHLRESGTLTPPDRALLASMAKAKQEQVGWRMVDDPATGAQVGLPTKQVPNTAKTRNGTRWSSAQGQIQAETFRLREPGLTLNAIFDQQKKEPPNRKLEVNLLRDDLFILSGWQGLKKFYVRAEKRDLEVRGLTILYDQATEGIMDAVTVVMSSAFAPFPGTGLAALLGGAPRRRVEYGTGIVVNPAGFVLTDRKLTDGCSVVEVSGHGYASLFAEDATAGIALLRLFGATGLAPAGVIHDDVGGAEVTLVGIPDPQTQGGGRTVATATAKLNGDSIQPLPQDGFAGAAALDSRGRLFGMVAFKPTGGAEGPSSASRQATVVSIDRLRRFLDSHHIAAAPGAVGVAAAKAAVVRVICARI